MTALKKDEFKQKVSDSDNGDDNNLMAKPRKCCTISVPLKEKKKKERPVEF